MQEVGGSIPPGSTTLVSSAWRHRRKLPPQSDWMNSEVAPSRYRGMAFHFVEAALRGDRSRKIGISI
jgi:hypothetical protein